MKQRRKEWEFGEARSRAEEVDIRDSKCKWGRRWRRGRRRREERERQQASRQALQSHINADTHASQ